MTLNIIIDLMVWICYALCIIKVYYCMWSSRSCMKVVGRMGKDCCCIQHFSLVQTFPLRSFNIYIENVTLSCRVPVPHSLLPSLSPHIRLPLCVCGGGGEHKNSWEFTEVLMEAYNFQFPFNRRCWPKNMCLSCKAWWSQFIASQTVQFCIKKYQPPTGEAFWCIRACKCHQLVYFTQ